MEPNTGRRCLSYLGGAFQPAVETLRRAATGINGFGHCEREALMEGLDLPQGPGGALSRPGPQGAVSRRCVSARRLPSPASGTSLCSPCRGDQGASISALVNVARWCFSACLNRPAGEAMIETTGEQKTDPFPRSGAATVRKRRDVSPRRSFGSHVGGLFADASSAPALQSLPYPASPLPLWLMPHETWRAVLALFAGLSMAKAPCTPPELLVAFSGPRTPPELLDPSSRAPLTPPELCASSSRPSSTLASAPNSSHTKVPEPLAAKPSSSSSDVPAVSMASSSTGREVPAVNMASSSTGRGRQRHYKPGTPVDDYALGVCEDDEGFSWKEHFSRPGPPWTPPIRDPMLKKARRDFRRAQRKSIHGESGSSSEESVVAYPRAVAEWNKFLDDMGVYEDERGRWHDKEPN